MRCSYHGTFRSLPRYRCSVPWPWFVNCEPRLTASGKTPQNQETGPPCVLHDMFVSVFWFRMQRLSTRVISRRRMQDPEKKYVSFVVQTACGSSAETLCTVRLACKRVVCRTRDLVIHCAGWSHSDYRTGATLVEGLNWSSSCSILWGLHEILHRRLDNLGR